MYSKCMRLNNILEVCLCKQNKNYYESYFGNVNFFFPMQTIINDLLFCENVQHFK